MKYSLMTLLFTFLLLLLVPLNSQAETKTLKKITKIDFSKGALFSGSKVSPDGAYLEARRQSKTKKFFVYRKHFKQKIRNSIHSI